MFISQFGIVAVAPGWSLVDYALQILCISLCFVTGFKKLMCRDLRFEYLYMKNSASVVPRQCQRLIDKNLFYLKKTNDVRLTCSVTYVDTLRVDESLLQGGPPPSSRQLAHTDTLVALIYGLPWRRAENIGFPARVSCFRVCKGRCVLFTGHIRAPPQCFRTLPVVFFSCSIIKIIHLKSLMLGGLWSSYIFFPLLPREAAKNAAAGGRLLFAKALT